MAPKGKVCLAYSGGLDTSCILKWLLEEGYEVVCFLANVGQEEDWDQVRQKAALLGASKMIITDLRREFVDELCFRAVQCNAQYEGRYLLGTSLARPVIARAQMKVAAEEGCDYVSHGCTGKGNDQVRFELAFLTIDPKIKIIAPWRMPEFFERFQGRADLLDYAAATGIPVTSTKAKPYSMDDNLAHCSYESGQLEDPSQPPPTDMWTRTIRTDDPLTAPNTPEDIQIFFEKGLPVKLVVGDKAITDSLELFLELNAIGKKHGIGRIDIVENRYVGIKSRGCYDSPAMTILRQAHLDIEGLVMDGKVRSLRDQFVTHSWSEILYNGLYFSPEREFVENSLVFSQKRVNGEVRLRCYKGNAYVIGRSSETEKLYSEEESSMDSLVDFSPVDTSGFISINAIRLKKYGAQKIEEGQSIGSI
ncbi:Argininosuccinate synthase [Ceratocystis lukuohia]|uniref:argininosuccinate synthase n=1 Tax=Ceratocystis lukuohia TaxID=2019550 RepID=A0ABR4MQB0_9PEZI